MHHPFSGHSVLFARSVIVDIPSGFTAVNAATDTVCTSNARIELCADILGKPARVVHVLDAPTHGTFNREDHLFPFPHAPYLLSKRRARDLGLVANLRFSSIVSASLKYLLDNPPQRVCSPRPVGAGTACRSRTRAAKDFATATVGHRSWFRATHIFSRLLGLSLLR
jgi:hypothetical protein